VIETISHNASGASTNLGGGWWCNGSTSEEIGDICENQLGDIKGFAYVAPNGQPANWYTLYAGTRYDFVTQPFFQLNPYSACASSS